MKFKKKLILGVDEDDVWKNIDLICKMYEYIIRQQQKKYNAVIEEYRTMTKPNADDSS